MGELCKIGRQGQQPSFQTVPNTPKHAQTIPNMPKLAQTIPNTPFYAFLIPNQPKLAQTGKAGF